MTTLGAFGPSNALQSNPKLHFPRAKMVHTQTHTIVTPASCFKLDGTGFLSFATELSLLKKKKILKTTICLKVVMMIYSGRGKSITVYKVAKFCN